MEPPATAGRPAGHAATPVPTKPSRAGHAPAGPAPAADAVADATAQLAGLLAGGTPVALACDVTLEGMLGATGIAYLAHAAPGQLRLVAREACQRQLGEVVLDAPPGTDDALVALARRVYRGFVRHVTQGCTLRRGGSCPRGCRAECAHRLVYAAASADPGAPEAIHRYLRLTFERGGAMRALAHDPRVVAVDELARLTLNECEHTHQFVRFSKLADGTLAAVFRPRADTIPLTAAHFARRLAPERFCIVDPTHLVAAFHEPAHGARGCDVVRLDRATVDVLAARHDLAADERHVQALWKRFYDGLALPGRDRSQRGYDLRAQWMPKRFWQGLPELDPGVGVHDARA